MKKFAVASMMAAGMLAVALTGCGGPSPESLIRADLESYFGDTDEAVAELTEELGNSLGEELDLLGIDEKEFSEAYLDGFNVEVGDITVDGDSAVAEVTLTAKSMTEIMTTFQEDFTAWLNSLDPESIEGEAQIYEQGGQIFMDAIKSIEPTSTTVEVTYTKNADGEWEMSSTAETDLTDALF